MADRVEIRNLTLEQAERLGLEHARKGARDIRITQQPDGLYAFSFLPGESDYPTEPPPSRSTR
jgi:hypothetical protein